MSALAPGDFSSWATLFSTSPISSSNSRFCSWRAALDRAGVVTVAVRLRRPADAGAFFAFFALLRERQGRPRALRHVIPANREGRRVQIEAA